MAQLTIKRSFRNRGGKNRNIHKQSYTSTKQLSNSLSNRHLKSLPRCTVFNWNSGSVIAILVNTQSLYPKLNIVIPCIKGLSEQYRHTLAKYRVKVFFKGTSTIKSLLMHPKDPIPDAQKTDIIYHWKCPVNNCTAECIGETNRSLKERISDHRNQTTSAIRNHHISTKHPKADLTEIKLPVPSETITSPQNTQKQNLKILQ